MVLRLSHGSSRYCQWVRRFSSSKSGHHLRGNRLFGTPTGQLKAELFPESESRFFSKVVDARIDFERGLDGQGIK